MTSIGEFAFSGCDSLASVTIGNGVTSIGEFAFSGCDSLASVTIGDSVTSIGGYAFSGCYKLVEVYNCSDLNITRGSSYYGEIGYYALNIYTPDSGESKLHTTDDGYIFCADESNVYLVGYKGNDTALTLPSNYNGGNYNIYGYAFYNCDSLTSINIPNSVTSIGAWAFYDCTSLTSIIFEDTTDWYRTSNDTDWQNQTNGTLTDVTNASQNATYFKNEYLYCWYKK